jgi:hypothetical protein
VGDIFDSGSNCVRCDRKSDYELCYTCYTVEGWREQSTLERELGTMVYQERLAREEIEEGKAPHGNNPNWTFTRVKR